MHEYKKLRRDGFKILLNIPFILLALYKGSRVSTTITLRNNTPAKKYRKNSLEGGETESERLKEKQKILKCERR